MLRRSGRNTKASNHFTTDLSTGNISPQEQKCYRPPKPRSLTLSNALRTNSPVLRADIQSLFAATIRAWPSLPNDRRRQLIDAFPPMYRVYECDSTGCLDCPLREEFVIKDTIIKRDVARFKRDIENGFYLKKRQEDGKKAMKERAQGLFDEYMLQHAEDCFGACKDAQHDQNWNDDTR